MRSETMGFQDYPFVSKGQAYNDSNRFPCHREVFLYINDYATTFGLTKLVRFETNWRVRSRMENGVIADETFYVVVVCNGHNTGPHLAEILGIDAWSGRVGSSDLDIFMDIAQVEVLGNMSSYDNLKMHSMIQVSFPFLDTNDIITMEDNCVGPLYKHTFPPALVAWLSFVGGVLSSQIGLPSEEEMMRDVEA
ncbi:hypothetical protein AAG906_002780 [Vitis piasezkii]